MIRRTRRIGSQKWNAIGRDTRAQFGEARRVGLRPVPPERDLRVACVLALCPAARCGREREREGLRRKRVHRLAVEVAPGIDVHLVDEQLVPPRGRRDLERGHERKIRDRAVARDEEDQVAAGCDLAGDAFEIVAGTVHENETGRGDVAQRLGVFDDRVEPCARILFMHRADGFQRDVVEAAELVSAARVALGSDAVPREIRPESFDGTEKCVRCREVAHIAQDVSLRAHDLVGLGEHAGAAVPDDFVDDAARERISRDAGECVRAAALERDAKFAHRLIRAPLRGNFRQPAAHDARALGETGGKSATQREKFMRHVRERVAVLQHECAQPRVRDRLHAVVEREHRADIWMHHEARECAQHFGGIVRLASAAALGVCDGDDAIEPGMHARERLELRGELAREARGARSGAEDDDEIARADTAPHRTPEAGKCRARLHEIHGGSGAETFFIEVEWCEHVGKIRLLGKPCAVELPHGECLQHGLVADVSARRDVHEREAERQPPREQRRASGDRLHRKAVAFENRVPDHARRANQRDRRASLDAARGDGDIVAGRGKPRDLVE